MLADCFEAMIGACFFSSYRLYEPLRFLMKTGHLPNCDLRKYSDCFAFKFDFGDSIIAKIIEEDTIKQTHSYRQLGNYYESVIQESKESFTDAKEYRNGYQRRIKMRKRRERRKTVSETEERDEKKVTENYFEAISNYIAFNRTMDQETK